MSGSRGAPPAGARRHGPPEVTAIATVCRVVDLQEIPVRDAAPLRFRIEVRRLHASGAYDAILYRLEDFKLTTSFVRDEDGAPLVADHQLFVVDDFFDPELFRSSSADETVMRVEAALRRQLGAPGETG